MSNSDTSGASITASDAARRQEMDAMRAKVDKISQSKFLSPARAVSQTFMMDDALGEVSPTEGSVDGRSTPSSYLELDYDGQVGERMTSIPAGHGAARHAATDSDAGTDNQRVPVWMGTDADASAYKGFWLQALSMSVLGEDSVRQPVEQHCICTCIVYFLTSRAELYLSLYLHVYYVVTDISGRVVPFLADVCTFLELYLSLQMCVRF